MDPEEKQDMSGYDVVGAKPLVGFQFLFNRRDYSSAKTVSYLHVVYHPNGKYAITLTALAFRSGVTIFKAETHEVDPTESFSAFFGDYIIDSLEVGHIIRYSPLQDDHWIALVNFCKEAGTLLKSAKWQGDLTSACMELFNRLVQPLADKPEAKPESETESIASKVVGHLIEGDDEELMSTMANIAGDPLHGMEEALINHKAYHFDSGKSSDKYGNTFQLEIDFSANSIGGNFKTPIRSVHVTFIANGGLLPRDKDYGGWVILKLKTPEDFDGVCKLLRQLYADWQAQSIYQFKEHWPRIWVYQSPHMIRRRRGKSRKFI